MSKVASALCATLVCVAACTAVPAAPPPVVIGLLSDATESAMVSGGEAIRGAELAVDIVNYASIPGTLPVTMASGPGRLGGAKLVLATADSQGDAAAAVKRAGELISAQHAVALVSADSAEVAAATASEMQRWRRPLLDAVNSADYLSELGLDWYFRLGPSDRSMAESAVAIVLGRAASRKGIRAEVVTEPGGDAAVGRTLLTEMADRAGVKVSATEATNASGPEDRLAVDPATTAVLAWAHTTGAALAILRALGTEPGGPPLLGLGAGFRQLTGPPAGAPLTLRPMAWSAELAARVPVARAVMGMYQKRFGVPMTEVAAMTFTAVLALAVAIDRAGSVDPAAIRAALRQTSLSATHMVVPWNGVRFAADGQNSLAAPVVEAWDGARFAVVSPPELAAQPLPWPGTQQ
jgi:branched-chain amino acid transport system substrate-binding protein